MIFRYVPFADVPRRLAQGWMVIGEAPAHHGFYSAILAWLCDCPVPA